MPGFVWSFLHLLYGDTNEDWSSFAVLISFFGLGWLENKFASKDFLAHVFFLARIVLALLITIAIQVVLASLNVVGAAPIVPELGFAIVTVASYSFVFSGGSSFLGTSVFKTSHDVPPFHQSLYWFVTVSLSLAALYIGGIGFFAGAAIIALDRSVVGLKTHDEQSRYSTDLNLIPHFERNTVIASPQANRKKSTTRSKSNDRRPSWFNRASLSSWPLDTSPFVFSSDLVPLGVASMFLVIRVLWVQ